MGRHSYSDRSTVEDSKVLDVFFLNTQGYFSGRRSGPVTWKLRENVTGRVDVTVTVGEREGTMALSYSVGYRGSNQRTDFDILVPLVKTGCNYGGGRWWFLCPTLTCRKRVAKLYLPPSSERFACRSCHQLTYESCRMSHSMIYRLAKSNGLTVAGLIKSIQ